MFDFCTTQFKNKTQIHFSHLIVCFSTLKGKKFNHVLILIIFVRKILIKKFNSEK